MFASYIVSFLLGARCCSECDGGELRIEVVVLTEASPGVLMPFPSDFILTELPMFSGMSIGVN